MNDKKVFTFIIHGKFLLRFNVFIITYYNLFIVKQELSSS